LGSLTYHTVWSQSGRSSARVMPIACASVSVLPGAWARGEVSLACAPVTQLYCGLFCLALYDASCSVGLLHNTYAAAPTQPISFATAAPHAAALPSSQWKIRVRSFFNFYASSRPKLPTLGPFLPRESTPDARNRLLASTAEARVSGGETCVETRRRWNRSDPTINIDRDEPTGRLKPTDRTDDTSANCRFA